MTLDNKDNSGFNNFQQQKYETRNTYFIHKPQHKYSF